MVVAVVVACQVGGAPPSGTASYTGTCTVDSAGDLTYMPARGEAGPAFRLSGGRGAAGYDVQVNAVDASGRYGPDARGTVQLDASLRTGTLSTPDLQTAAGDSVIYWGRWTCASVVSVTPVPEPTGGPSSPR